ncbi:MAG: GntR family transcriptional regulator [Allomuricauda sp.]
MQSQILRNQVKNHLLGQIQKGELKVGQTINLAALSRGMGISVTPIREALSQLEHAKAIKAIPKRGFVVAHLDKKEASDLYHTVAQLEMMALESSNFSEDDLALLRLQQSRTQQMAAPMDRLKARFDFHALLVKNCSNMVLLQVLDNLKVRLHFYEQGFGEDTSFYGLMNNQNEAILQAIEEDNVPTATLILKMNWMTVLEYVQNRIG